MFNTADMDSLFFFVFDLLGASASHEFFYGIICGRSFYLVCKLKNRLLTFASYEIILSQNFKQIICPCI